jgi:hypothetical protein
MSMFKFGISEISETNKPNVKVIWFWSIEEGYSVCEARAYGKYARAWKLGVTRKLVRERVVCY